MYSIENILKLASKKEKKIILIIPTLDDLKRIKNGENYKNLLWYTMMINLANRLNLSSIFNNGKET